MASMKKFSVIFLVCALIAGTGSFLSGCSYLGFGNDDEEADTLDQEFDAGGGSEAKGEAKPGDMQSEIKDLSEKQVENQKKIEGLEDTIGSLEASLKNLQESKREVEDKLNEMKKRGGGGADGEVDGLKEKLATLQDEIKAMKTRTTEKKTERDYSKARGSSLEGVSVKKGYDKAVQLFNARKYEDALDNLKELEGMNPPADLADNIYFWMGQCQYKLDDFDKAIDSFHTVIDNYSKGNKVHDSRYMLGLSYSAIGEKSKAIEVLQNALDDRPPSAIKAKIQAAIRNIE